LDYLAPRKDAVVVVKVLEATKFAWDTAGEIFQFWRDWCYAVWVIYLAMPPYKLRLMFFEYMVSLPAAWR
jgi:hypothetical protein